MNNLLNIWSSLVQAGSLSDITPGTVSNALLELHQETLKLQFLNIMHKLNLYQNT